MKATLEEQLACALELLTGPGVGGSTSERATLTVDRIQLTDTVGFVDAIRKQYSPGDRIYLVGYANEDFYGHGRTLPEALHCFFGRFKRYLDEHLNLLEKKQGYVIYPSVLTSIVFGDGKTVPQEQVIREKRARIEAMLGR